jgi:hypothetical protein
VSQQPDSARSVWLTDVPEWFLAVAAFVYATGFLVVFTYFESFGVREAGGDFFRVKYVHVGILCLLFMGIIAVPSYTYAALYALRRRHSATVQPAQ